MKTLTCAMVFANPVLRDILLEYVDTLESELSVRARNCIENGGIEHIWQLVEKTEADLFKLKNFGRKNVTETKEAIAKRKLVLGHKLSRELKTALNIPLTGNEPREYVPTEPLPSLETIEARITQLTWLRDNYDQVKAGLKAFEQP